MRPMMVFRYTVSGFFLGVVLALLTLDEDPFSTNPMSLAEFFGAAFGAGGPLGALLGAAVDAVRAVLRGARS